MPSFTDLQLNRHHVRNLGVPSQIKCNTCKRVKGKDAFANKRHQDLLNHMNDPRTPRAFNPVTHEWISCIPCTPKQVTELQCCDCDQWKGLDKFSKVQRRTPDNARCWPCQEERGKYEPGENSDDSDSTISGSDDSEDAYSDLSDNDTATATDRMDGVSLNDSGTATYRSSTTGGVSLTGSSSQTLSRSLLRSTTDQSTSRPSSTAPSVVSERSSNLPAGFNPNAYGNPGYRASPSVSSDPKKFAKPLKAVPPKELKGGRVKSRGKGKGKAEERDVDDIEIQDSESDSE